MTLRPVDGQLPLTEECHHYEDLSEVPDELRKYVTSLQLHSMSLGTNLLRYFQQRYSIFTFYDYDIRLTDDAWFGVTPEPVATLVT